MGTKTLSAADLERAISRVKRVPGIIDAFVEGDNLRVRIPDFWFGLHDRQRAARRARGRRSACCEEVSRGRQRAGERLMAKYDYVCAECGWRGEIEHPISACDDERRCGECTGALQREIPPSTSARHDAVFQSKFTLSDGTTRTSPTSRKRKMPLC